MPNYTEIEQNFKKEVTRILSEPYTLRRMIAGWPHVYSLSVLLQTLDPIENEEDKLFLQRLQMNYLIK